eukprot:COSAG01_NODE_20390_length_956_cov_2.003501_2_plen_257_part_01
MVVLPLRLLFFNSHLHPAATAVAAWQARVMTGGAAQGLSRSRRRSRHSRQDVAHVRSDRGYNPSGADHDCDGSTSGRGCVDGGSSCSGQRHSLPHERAAELEEEPIAGVSDVGDAAQDVMHGVARLLQRGGTPMDDYGGQPQMLYDAHFSLFPIQEGLELGTKLSVHKTRHMCLFYDCRFAQDLSLLFGLADTLSRHAVHKAVHVQARTTPHAQKQVEELMKDGGVRRCESTLYPFLWFTFFHSYDIIMYYIILYIK